MDLKKVIKSSLENQCNASLRIVSTLKTLTTNTGGSNMSIIQQDKSLMRIFICIHLSSVLNVILTVRKKIWALMSLIVLLRFPDGVEIKYNPNDIQQAATSRSGQAHSLIFGIILFLFKRLDVVGLFFFWHPEGTQVGGEFPFPLTVFHSIYQQSGASWSTITRDLM